MFVGKIWYKARRFLNNIYSLKDATMRDCEAAQVDINYLLGTCRLIDKLGADDESIEDDVIPILPF